MKQDITETPTALAGINPGTRYTLQNKTRLPVLFEVADSDPTDDSGAFVLQIAKDDGAAVVSAPSGSSVWVWASRVTDGNLVYAEVA